jgi:hypothetical protein
MHHIQKALSIVQSTLSPVNGAHDAAALLRRSFDGGAALTFKPLVQALELLGWQRDQDLLSHLYDFR